MKNHLWRLFLLMLVFSLAAGCSSDDVSDEEAALTATIRSTWGDKLVALDAEPPYPPTNSPASAGFDSRIDLGKALFYDPVLSGDNDVSCAHCHHPGFAWGDGIALSIGVGGVGLGPDRARTLPPGEAELEEWEFMTPRNSPSVLDTGRFAPAPGNDPWEGVMFWDGREDSLEKQARGPLRSRDEMKHDAYGAPAAVGMVCEELKTIPEYITMFKAAFPDEFAQIDAAGDPDSDIIDAGNYSRAVAAYERELYTADSPFDRFARGDDSALSMSQKRGLKLFFDVGCDGCHSGAMFSDFGFYALGVAQGGPGKPPIHEHGDGNDLGRYGNTTMDEDRYRFRAPSLRNLSLTAPYFHTGGTGTAGDYQTLRQVVEFFNRGGNDLAIEASRLDDFMEPQGLGDTEMDDLVAFLESLTGTRIGSSRIDVRVPTSVPSGLAPPAVLEPVLSN